MHSNGNINHWKFLFNILEKSQKMPTSIGVKWDVKARGIGEINFPLLTQKLPIGSTRISLMGPEIHDIGTKSRNQ